MSYVLNVLQDVTFVLVYTLVFNAALYIIFRMKAFAKDAQMDALSVLK